MVDSKWGPEHPQTTKGQSKKLAVSKQSDKHCMSVHLSFNALSFRNFYVNVHIIHKCWSSIFHIKVVDRGGIDKILQI